MMQERSGRRGNRASVSGFDNEVLYSRSSVAYRRRISDWSESL